MNIILSELIHLNSSFLFFFFLPDFLCFCAEEPRTRPQRPLLANHSTDQPTGRELGYLGGTWALGGLCLMLRYVGCRWSHRKETKSIKKCVCSGPLASVPAVTQRPLRRPAVRASIQPSDCGNPGLVPQDSLISTSSSASHPGPSV